jgi:hypothetical protein
MVRVHYDEGRNTFIGRRDALSWGFLRIFAYQIMSADDWEESCRERVLKGV